MKAKKEMNSNRQRAIALRAEAGQFREQAQRRNIKVKQIVLAVTQTLSLSGG